MASCSFELADYRSTLPRSCKTKALAILSMTLVIQVRVLKCMTESARD